MILDAASFCVKLAVMKITFSVTGSFGILSVMEIKSALSMQLITPPSACFNNPRKCERSVGLPVRVVAVTKNTTIRCPRGPLAHPDE